MEGQCHLTGMLDRDQRTAKPTLRTRQDVPTYIPTSHTSSCGCCRDRPAQTGGLRNSPVSHGCIPGRTSPSASRMREKEQRARLWVTLPRLHRTFILCFYLILLALPKTSSAPVKMEKWMMPCGHKESGSKSNQKDLLQTIIDQSKRSLVKIEDFRDKFALKAFGNNWNEVQEFQSGIGSLKWFPKIDKELGKPLSQDELEKIELESLLRDSYQYLQIVAVAVDQMITDEEKRNGPLAADYRSNIESYVLSVLCEIQTATNALSISRHSDVQRDVIDGKDRQGDLTTTMTRHYLIIRDYLKLLEYIVECYEYVKSRL